MNETTVAPAGIYSTLATDDDFAELVELFVAEIPDRKAVLTKAFAEQDWELLRRTAHQLKGAVGSYGFEPATPYAKSLEYAVRDQEPYEAIEAKLTELLHVFDQLKAGTAP